jgi:predicted PurR-regulated permease PerM/ribosomal protein S18 acetylase RimI-like enzyme
MSEQNKPQKGFRRWSTFTKRSVALMVLILLGLALYRFRSVIPPLMIAFLVAFILHSIVEFLTSRLHISHGSATNIVFLTLIVIMLGAVAGPVSATIPSVREIVYFVENDLTELITEIDAFLDEPIVIWNYTLDLSTISDELVGAIRSFVSSVAEGTLDIVREVASGIFWLIIILTVAFYLVKDSARFIEQFDNLSPPGYREDAVRLRHQITDVWNAFLRGQLVMGLAMAVITTVVCLTIGLPYAPMMGLIAGVTEFIPNVGPILALIPAVLVALFEGSRVFVTMSHFWFAMLVIGAYVVIQQVEGNILIPRILGDSLDLHPLLVLISIIVGGNMAGIIGMLLAAPVLATLRVISNYIFCRLYDRDPFAEPEKPPPQPGLVARACQSVWCRLMERAEKRREKASKPRIRPARARDRPAVDAICAQVWEGDDYVPRVWDEWLADPHGQLLTAEVNKRVVGFGKLSRLADDEWWLEGLRVDPAYRQQKIGGLLHGHMVEKARQVGRGTLRLGTHSDNEPAHRLAACEGFRHVATYQRYRADPLPVETLSLRRLTEQDLPAAWALAGESARYRASGGLYEVLWRWKNLTRERLARHLAAGDAWGTGTQEELSALALVYRSEETLSVGLVDGQDEALAAVLRELRELAAQLGCTEILIKPLDDPALVAAVESVGYEQIQDKNLWIFELGLEEEAVE